MDSRTRGSCTGEKGKEKATNGEACGMRVHGQGRCPVQGRCPADSQRQKPGRVREQEQKRTFMEETVERRSGKPGEPFTWSM